MVIKRNREKSKVEEVSLNMIGYCRVSSFGQRENTSLEAQEDVIRQICELNSYHLIDIIKDVDSGTKSDRDGYQVLLDRLKSDPTVSGVVASKFDRLYRGLKPMADLMEVAKSNGKHIHTRDGDTREKMGKMMAEMLGMIAGWEADSIRERVTSGRIANFHKHGKAGGEGKGITGVPPFGYYYVDGIINIDPEKAELVKLIFQERSKGNSFQKIADMLNLKGIVTNRNKPFSRMTIKGIIENRFYLGEYKYGEETAYDHHKPIVSKNIFTRANRV